MGLEKAYSKIDLLTNILTIIVAIIIISLAIQRYLLPSGSASKSPTVGRTVTLANFDLSGSNRNVLVVMMKGCRFCEESMDFYKSLINERQGTGNNVIAVFPPGSSEIGAYLRNFGLTEIEVKYADLSGMEEVDGTPTIIVTDPNGKITKSWVGKLSPEKEREVKSFLQS